MSLHNDLHTWAGRARATGHDTIFITVETADQIVEALTRGAADEAISALRMADETFRDLGWHSKYEVTSAAISKAEGRS